MVTTPISEKPPGTPPPSAERTRLEFVDGLRALAALFVVLHHAWLTIPGKVESHGTDWLNLGHFAVDVFIVLSGFCLALPMTRPGAFGVLRGGALQFYKRRARRILPPYYFALAVSLALIWTLIGSRTGTHWDVALPVTTVAVISHLLLVQNFIDAARINHAMWSIAVEWQIYFLLPLIALGWRRIGAVATTLVTAACAYAVMFAFRSALPEDGDTWMTGYVALFAVGTLASVIAASPEPRWRKLLRPLPWTIGAIVLALMFKLLISKTAALYLIYCRLAHIPDNGSVTGGGYDTSAYFLEDFVLGLLSAVVLILACCPARRNWLRQALAAKPLVFTGSFAYSIYLLHAPLLQVLWQYGIAPLRLAWQAQFLLLAFVGVPILIGISYFFFLGCEKPWLVRKANESMREIAQDAVVSPAP